MSNLTFEEQQRCVALGLSQAEYAAARDFGLSPTQMATCKRMGVNPQAYAARLAEIHTPASQRLYWKDGNRE